MGLINIPDKIFARLQRPHRDDVERQIPPQSARVPDIVNHNDEDIFTSQTPTFSDTATDTKPSLGTKSGTETTSETAFGVPLSYEPPPRYGFDVFATRRLEHKRRLEELREILRPISDIYESQASVILLCWGRPDQSYAMPLGIPHGVDDEQIWRLIRHGWYHSRGRWRLLIPLYGVRSVSTAEVSLLGQNPDHSSYFMAAYKRENLDESAKELRKTVADNIKSNPLPCHWSSGIYRVLCHPDCNSEGNCPTWDAVAAAILLDRVNGRAHLTRAFMEPSIARGNDLLSTDLLIGEQNILQGLEDWHRPDLHQLRLKGLVIDEGWNLSPVSAAYLVSALVLVSVVAAKLIFGAWDIAWGAGSCVIAAATFVQLYVN